MMMALLTLLPMDVLQLNAALEHGYAYARSAEFMGKPIFDVLVWMRMPGDLRFATAAALLTWFVTRHWLMPVADPALDQTTRTGVVEAVQQEVV